MGSRFYLGLAGITIAAITAAILFFFLFSWVWAATGLIGAFIFFGAVAFALGWLRDRKDARERDSFA